MSTSPPSGPKKPNLVSVTTINRDGSRFFLHPADVKGRMLTLRRWFALLLLAVYILLPWIPINGHPAMFFDVENGRYHVFGLTFLTQDLWLLFFLLSGFGFALITATSLFGRLWCGWACPYTVFLEHVFRRIERIIEGDAQARKKLDAEPWTPGKILKRGLKHGAFLLCSAAISHIFLSYFISLPRLYQFMQGPPAEHLRAFAVVVFLTISLYFCFAWFREQFCIILCPYGRIQSALTDDDTVTIGYDETRGEPRGKKKDGEKGDCIDCRRCVQVCPTGIDIRNGLQLECIGCAACIDACDDIMRKVKRPTGLIRYDSMNGLQGKPHRFLRPRTLLYVGFSLLGAVALTHFLGRLSAIHVSVGRMAGKAHFTTDTDVRNQFKIELATKLNVPTTFTLAIKDPPAGMFWLPRADETIVVPGQAEMDQPFTVIMKRKHYKGPFKVTLLVTAQPGDVKLERQLEFVGPDPRLLPDVEEKSEHGDGKDKDDKDGKDGKEHDK